MPTSERYWTSENDIPISISILIQSLFKILLQQTYSYSPAAVNSISDFDFEMHSSHDDFKKKNQERKRPTISKFEFRNRPQDKASLGVFLVLVIRKVFYLRM
jgi:hypothetical protein